MEHFSLKSRFFLPDTHSFQSILTKFGVWMEGEWMEDDWMEGAWMEGEWMEGGGGWCKMAEGGEREGDKSFIAVFQWRQPPLLVL